jgi:nucleotide-sensitive chloride channel 1A
MQLVTSPASDEEDELYTVSLTIIPHATSISTPAPSELNLSSGPVLSETQQLFEALSACSNLHPDPNPNPDDDEEEEGLSHSLAFQAGLIQAGSRDGGMPPALAAGGWITAENMHEFVDEEGNWIGGEEEGEGLGPGAGTVRQREEEAEENGHGDEGEGEAEETKWRRTG